MIDLALKDISTERKENIASWKKTYSHMIVIS